MPSNPYNVKPIFFEKYLTLKENIFLLNVEFKNI